MRTLKILGIALGSLVALLIVLALAIHLFVNPNDFKSRIAAAVKSSTGRELSLPGDIKLSVFPWIALELGPATLGSPPGFGDEPFASVQHVAFRVQLLPLLHKDLKIGRVQVAGLDLRLKRNAAGKGNWQGTGENAAPPSKSESTSGTQLQLPDLDGVQVESGRIAYQQMVVDKVNLDVGHIAANVSIPVVLSLQLTSAPGAKPLPLTLKSELKLSLAAQTMDVPSFALQLAGASLSGNLTATRILDAPAVQGQFHLEPVALRNLMDQLGIAPPETRDPKALSLFAVSGSFSYGNNAARLQSLTVQLDQSTLKGSAAVDNLDSMQTSFDLALDHVDIDHYLAPEKATAKTVPSVPARADAKVGQKSADTAGGFSSLNTRGTMTVDSAKIGGITLGQVHVGVLAKDGVAHLAPITAKLYGGDSAGDVTLDSKAEKPVLKLEQSLTNVDLAQLLQDLANTRRLSGRGNVSVNLTTRGASGDDILKSMEGRVGLNLTNGAIEGIDVWLEVRRAMALVQKQAPPLGSDSGRTQFDTFKASADILNGVATTRDLTIASQNLRVAGKGTSNLLTKAIDYQIQTTIFKAAPTATVPNAGTLAEIPLLITGTVSNPSVRPDLEGLARAGLQQQIDQHKDELKQKLGDQLKGLLGR